MCAIEADIVPATAWAFPVCALTRSIYERLFAPIEGIIVAVSIVYLAARFARPLHTSSGGEVVPSRAVQATPTAVLGVPERVSTDVVAAELPLFTGECAAPTPTLPQDARLSEDAGGTARSTVLWCESELCLTAVRAVAVAVGETNAALALAGNADLIRRARDPARPTMQGVLQRKNARQLSRRVRAAPAVCAAHLAPTVA